MIHCLNRLALMLVIGTTPLACKVRQSGIAEATLPKSPAACVPKLELPGPCPPTLAQIMLRTNAQLDAMVERVAGANALERVTARMHRTTTSSGAGLRLVDSAAPFALEANNRFTTERIALKVAELPEYQLFASMIADIDPSLPREVLVTPVGSEHQSAHPVYYGVADMGQNGGLVSVFLKPIAEDINYAIHEANNGLLDAQITQMLRDLNISPVVYPDTRYVELVESLSYTTVIGRPTNHALLIANAAEDGKHLIPLDTFFDSSNPGKLSELITYTASNPAKSTYYLPKHLRHNLVAALHEDALVRHLIGDADGHVDQYLVQVEFVNDSIKDARLVSLDRGGAAMVLIFGDLVAKGGHHDNRIHLLSPSTKALDLGGENSSLPLPDEIRPEFIDKLTQLRESLKAVVIDPKVADPKLERAFQDYMTESHEAIVLKYGNDLQKSRLQSSVDARARSGTSPAEGSDAVQERTEPKAKTGTRQGGVR